MDTIVMENVTDEDLRHLACYYATMFHVHKCTRITLRDTLARLPYHVRQRFSTIVLASADQYDRDGTPMFFQRPVDICKKYGLTFTVV